MEMEMPEKDIENYKILYGIFVSTVVPVLTFITGGLIWKIINLPEKYLLKVDYKTDQNHHYQSLQNMKVELREDAKSDKKEILKAIEGVHMRMDSFVERRSEKRQNI